MSYKAVIIYLLTGLPGNTGATAFVAILQPDILRREGSSGAGTCPICEHGNFHMKHAVILNIIEYLCYCKTPMLSWGASLPPVLLPFSSLRISASRCALRVYFSTLVRRAAQASRMNQDPHHRTPSS